MQYMYMCIYCDCEKEVECEECCCGELEWVDCMFWCHSFCFFSVVS